MIKSIQEVVRDQLNEAVNAAMTKYGAAIHPVYLVDRNGKPAHCGTCFGLEIDGGKYLVTAAHVADNVVKSGGYVPGGDKLERLSGPFFSSIAPAGDRDNDRYDFAWMKLPDHDLELFGWATFISSSDLCANRTPPVGRVYLAAGFPRSKNKKSNPNTRKLRPKVHRYASTGKLMPNLFASLGLTGEHHIVIDHENRSLDEDGIEWNSIYPRGMSGGPMFDLGRKGSVDDLARVDPYEGRLAGIIIEKYDEHNALVAVKIELLVQSITASQKENTSPCTDDESLTCPSRK